MYLLILTMIRIILTLILAIFSITPPTGDQVEILTPKPYRGTGRLHGFYAEIKALRRTKGHTWRYSFPRFPNISKFEIVLGYFNPLLLAFGLAGRLPGEISTETNRNHRYNRYLVFSQVLLFRHLKDSKRYWAIASRLIQRSNLYAIGCMHLIDKNWYRKLTYKQYKALLRDLDKIRGRVNGQMSPYMSYHRTYIPKGTDTFRPLGVPTKAWRVYLNMLLHPLVIQIDLGNSQHGFRPGRGTLTAWKSVLKDVLPSADIYEFDLKQCFPSISLPRLDYRLRVVHGIPRDWANYYTALNFVPPTFKSKLELNESQSLALIESLQHNYNHFLTEPVKMHGGLPRMYYFAVHNNALSIYRKALDAKNPFQYLNEMIKKLPPLQFRPYSTYPYYTDFPGRGYNPAHQEDTGSPVEPPGGRIYFPSKGDIPHWEKQDYDPGMLPRTLLDPRVEWITTIPPDILTSFLSSLKGISSYYEQAVQANVERTLYGTTFGEPTKSYQQFNHEWVKLIGTAQGSPLSPYLAAVALDEIQKNLPSGVKILLYADDGLFYGPNVRAFIDSGAMKRLLSSFGFTVHPDKSRWIRVESQWYKPLKFLGISYNGDTDVLQASTRKGATLIYSKKELLEAEYDINLAMELGDKLPSKIVEADKMSRRYLSWRLFGKAAIARDLVSYYQRLYHILTSLDSIRLPHTSGATYDGQFDAFLWWYYILVSRLFYMSKDYLIRTLASGVLALRDKRKVYAYMKDNFLPSGLEATPSAEQVLQGTPLAPKGYTRKTTSRWFSGISNLFSYTETSSETSMEPSISWKAFPLYALRHAFVVESHNSYLKAFRNKYTWSNFIKSSYAGFIMSRLYNNTFMFDDFMQNFSYTHTGCSIAAFLSSPFFAEAAKVNVFTGTSFAVYEELKLFRVIQRKRLKPVPGGYLSAKKSFINGNTTMWDSSQNPSSRII